MTDIDLLRQLVEKAPDAILAADVDGIIRFWNSGAQRIFGYSEAEALGKSLDLIIPENQRVRHWEGYRRVMETGMTRYSTRLLAVPAIRTDGGRLSTEFSIVLLRDGNGTITGSGAIMRDVSERWEKEKELKKRLSECEASR
ncbi:PAS domain S-box protein [Geobacter sp. DSM 9736]|uniref:PAS domain-containing protein n=1 Tax=Geobacter sp. DSM 9736 TaxID=1277350 RepID=UPI000B507509|nr:PAS domain S-box protein [Geobacter sp. DSM 9736]SNB45200.1 PAS domain S-box-containing protein [Geobacter sp. DSM 9736]